MEGEPGAKLPIAQSEAEERYLVAYTTTSMIVAEARKIVANAREADARAIKTEYAVHTERAHANQGNAVAVSARIGVGILTLFGVAFIFAALNIGRGTDALFSSIHTNVAGLYGNLFTHS